MFNSSIDNNENNLSLIDNGNEFEIINESFAHEKKLKITELDKRDRIRLILGDGTRSQIIKKTATIDLKIGDHQEKLKCYLAKIEDCTLLLEDGWLQKHNPKIDWRKRAMKFSQNCLNMGCVNQKTTIIADEEKLKNKKPNDENTSNDASKSENIKSISSKRFLRLIGKPEHQVYCLYPRNEFEKELEYYQEKILAAVIAGAVDQSDHDKFMKIKPKYSIDELKARVPKAYHNEIEVFSQKKADELPPHRKEDHGIVLKPGTEPPFIKSYKPISEQKLAAAKKYLDEHLEKDISDLVRQKLPLRCCLSKNRAVGLDSALTIEN